MCPECLLCSFAVALHCFASYPVAAPAAWYTLQCLLRGVYFAFLLFTLPPRSEHLLNVECLLRICAVFFMHAGRSPASITQSGLTTGKSVHGKPKYKARRSIYNKSYMNLHFCCLYSRPGTCKFAMHLFLRFFFPCASSFFQEIGGPQASKASQFPPQSPAKRPAKLHQPESEMLRGSV